MAQIQDISTLTKSPFTSMTVWTADTSAGGTPPSAWIVSVSSTDVSSAASLAITNKTTVIDVACVYDPASKDG